jgi:hypothetical protein
MKCPGRESIVLAASDSCFPSYSPHRQNSGWVGVYNRPCRWVEYSIVVITFDPSHDCRMVWERLCGAAGWESGLSHKFCLKTLWTVSQHRRNSKEEQQQEFRWSVLSCGLWEGGDLGSRTFFGLMVALWWRNIIQTYMNLHKFLEDIYPVNDLVINNASHVCG